MTAGPWCSDPGEGLQKGEEKRRKYFQSCSQGTGPWAWLPHSVRAGQLREQVAETLKYSICLHVEKRCPAWGWADRTGSEQPIMRCSATG